MQCPVGLKLNNLSDVLKINENEPGSKKHTHFQKTRDGKQILRDVMARHIPHTITEAQKQGFSSPDASWFKGESIEFVKQRLLNARAPIYSVLDRTTVESLLNQHLNGEQNRRLLIWSLLNLSAWMDCTL
jgi:asparagine synthase (glutamine-hydrolysing)